jgi:hypothetical protein
MVQGTSHVEQMKTLEGQKAGGSRESRKKAAHIFCPEYQCVECFGWLDLSCRMSRTKSAVQMPNVDFGWTVSWTTRLEWKATHQNRELSSEGLRTVLTIPK